MDWKTRISALSLWIFVVLSAIGNGNAEKRVVCYYTNWSVYRPGTAKFSPQNINPYLCTHLIYAFGGFTKENTLKPFDKYQDIEKGGYAKFTGLKTYNKDLKTMLAIGGWNEGSSRFSPMVADPGRRKEFVKNTVKFLRQNHFDGLDLDWEYPAFRDGGKPRDRNNYADLVQELREEFERESSKTGRPRLLLSMAVPAGIEYIDKGYDVPRLNEYLDFINLLSYDYHSAYEPAANHHSPLFPLEEDNEYNYDTELTIDFTITHLLKSGASSEKIVLGIPTYGRSYTLFNEEATDIGAPADGPGEEGDATREKGYLAYYEICESIAKSDEWQVVQPNPSAMGPYAFRGNQWVGYDDENIVRAKARYVNEKKLGGIMFWSIDNDDFRGKCHGRPYPLIEAAKEAMLVEDEKSSSGTKTRVADSRKKSRPQGGQRPQVNSISRKFKTGRRTTTTRTTETPSTKRRISSGSRSNSRSNGRARGSEEVEDDQEDNEEEANSVKSSEKPRQRTRAKNTRLRNQSLGGGRKKQQNSRNHEEKKNEEPEEETRSKKLTTPEPPTTPDPGTDFKCEDEGFFPHPRDCKKYFWCLDSGPGGLGIVGHQFTCPSGLVFNKAADSCDYPRNVVCPKTKTSQSAVTTTRAPITAATSRTTYLHKATPRTTTPKADSEEEYEYYDDEEVDEDAADSREIEEEIRSTTTPKTYKTISRNRPTTTNSPPSTTTTTQPTTSTRTYKTTTERDTSYEDEEDPRVIKELIDLIKKAGGIEQLEKQLLYQDKNSGGNAETTEGNGKSTPATISRSLYERVLNRQATRIAGGFLGSFSTTESSKSPKAEENAPKNSRTGFINGPGGAQFEGLDQVPEVKTLRRTTKHQYVTIDRQRQTTSESPADEDEELDEVEEDDNKNVASSEDRAVSSSHEKSSNRRFTPSYVNIRRSRPSTTTSENDVDLKDEGEDALEEENGDSGEEELEEPVTEGRKVVKSDEESSTPKSRYTNVQRFRSTTLRHSAEEATEEAPLKKDAESSPTTTTTSTTTEKMIPVTEEISEISTATTSDPRSSSSDSLENEKPENSTREWSSDDAPSTSEPETTKIKNEPSLRLVENSATEILLTTVAASSISTGSNYDSFTRGPTVAAVSQPRPFGYSRRGRPTTTAIPPTASTSTVTEQTRTKVSSRPTRNFARSSSASRLRGGRPESRLATSSVSTTESHVRDDQDDEKYVDGLGRKNLEEKAVFNEQETSGNKSRVSSTRRGVSRFTPPSYRPETNENFKNNGRTRASALSEEFSTTESSFVEENSVVPIYRGRSRSTTVSSATSDSVATESSRRRSRPSKVGSTTTSSPRTLKVLEDSPIVRIYQQGVATPNTRGQQSNGRDDENDDKILNIRVFDKFYKVTTSESPSADPQDETTFSALSSGPDVENFTIDAATADLSSTIESNANESDLDSSSSPASPEIEETTKPIRKKILRRRRPVASSTSVASTTKIEETSENSSGPRRRKVIRRLRPSLHEETEKTKNFEAVDLTTERHGTLPESTGDEADFLESQTTRETTTLMSRRSRPFTIIVESPEKSENLLGDSVDEETSTWSLFDGIYGEDSSTLLPTTAVDASTEKPKKIESATEFIGPDDYLTEENDSLGMETTSMTSSSEPTSPDDETEVFSTESPPTTLELRATTSATSTTSESRFVRKKFVRKRPSSSASNSRRFGFSGSSNRASFPSQPNDLDVLSNRRKNLFVRRRPVSSTSTTPTSPLTHEDPEDSSDFDDFVDDDDDLGESVTKVNDFTETGVDFRSNSDFDDFWKNYTVSASSESSQTVVAVTLPDSTSQDFTNPIANSNENPTESFENEPDSKVVGEAQEAARERLEINNYRKPDQRPKFKVPQSLRKSSTVESTTESTRSTPTALDSSPEESAETTLADELEKSPDHRQGRTRFGAAQKGDTEERENTFPREDFTEKFRSPGEQKDATKTEKTELSSSFWLTQNSKTRVYPKRLTSTTEQTVTETLIPAKKFDYVADAQLRKQQSLRTTQRYEDTTKMSREDENLVEEDSTTPSSSDKPQITRLVTSVVESGTTERQIIHIRTKYSSLTSTTRIPAQNVHNLKETHADKSRDSLSENSDEQNNEIRENTESPPERSTLSIESEFSLKNRLTTESTMESSTIEIESVFSNLIARDSRS